MMPFNALNIQYSVQLSYQCCICMSCYCCFSALRPRGVGEAYSMSAKHVISKGTDRVCPKDASKILAAPFAT